MNDLWLNSVPVRRTRVWTDDEIRIESLKPSTKYMLQVSAKNEVGVGRPYMLEIETIEARK